jgi:hypothetical protein
MLRSGARLLGRTATRAAVAAPHGAVRVGVFARAAGVRVMSGAGDVYARTGLDPNIFKGRKVIIFQPPAGVTQSGQQKRAEWKVQ